MDLAILIPSRNEMFLMNTVEDALKNLEADTEIIAVLDGVWADPPVRQHERVNILHTGKVVGQRAAANLAAKLTKAKYVMKVDGHCAFDKGFDRKMLEGFAKVGDNVTMVPIMRNLWAFDWKCLECGKRWYQGPTPTKCHETDFKKTGQPCTSTRFKRRMMWVGKHNPQSWSYCFDAEPHFQYYEEYKHRPEVKEARKTGFTETMSLQGSCFMLTRENYFKWQVSDEVAGSWGNQGLEVACATWLSGGRCLVNHATWYAHMFRTQGGDFSFPYHIGGRTVQQTKNYVKDKFWAKKHPTQIYPVSWLVKRFWPVKGWTQANLDSLTP